MASKALARPLVSVSAAIGLKRGYATAPKIQQSQQRMLGAVERKRIGAVQIPRQNVQQAFRRGYAEISTETQRVVKKRSWSLLRWTWRLTWVSALGGVVYMSYGIYQSRTPAEQVDPDPTKKTLVVLGMRRRLMWATGAAC